MSAFISTMRAAVGKNYYQWAILTCIFLFFTTAMTVKSGANIFLVLPLLLGIPLMKVADRRQLWLLLSLMLPFCVLLMQYMTGIAPKINILDAPSRLLLAGIALFAFTQLDKKHLTLACYGCILGAFGVGIWSYLSTQIPACYWKDGSRATNSFSNPIPFGMISMLLAFISLVLPLPATADKKQRTLFWLIKILACCSGIIAGYASGSRSAVLVFIPLLFIGMIGLSNFNIKKALLGCLIAAIAASVFIESSDNQLRTRIHEGITEVTSPHIDADTSMGRRIFMWDVAVDIIKDHPLLGIGKGNLKQELIKRDVKNPDTDEKIGFSHPHNELLTMMVDAGIFGLIAGVLLYLIPSAIFVAHLRSEDRYTRFAATAGSMVVTGFFLAGLMDSYFWIVSQTAFYGMSVAIFSAIILSRRLVKP